MQLFTTARKEFEAEFNFLEENTEKHKTYSVTKEVKGIDEKRDAIIRTISHKLQFIDGAKFVSAHDQILLIILLKKLMKLNLNMEMTIKNVKLLEFNTKVKSFILNTQTLKNNLMRYKCQCYNKNYQKKFEEKLKTSFADTYKFSNHGIFFVKFISFLRRGVYPYKYINDLEKFTETSFPEKEDSIT